jgi:hypothetical protein
MDSNRRSIESVLGVAVLVVAAALLYFFAPTDHRFYPRCIFHSLTGLACPGCGSLRAAHNLLHGNFAAAFRLNPLVLTIFPLALGVWLVRGDDAFSRLRPIWIWLLVALIMLFSILRNLPVPPFSYFRP